MELYEAPKKKLSKDLLTSLAFTYILMHLDYDQVVLMQALNRYCYKFTIPRFLKNDESTIRP
jgi:hypothetical protein